MLEGLFIFVDDDYTSPIYSDPDPADVDSDVWEALCEAIEDAHEGDVNPSGNLTKEGVRAHWNVFRKTGLSFACIVDDSTKIGEVDRYLARLSRHYLDEIEDIRHPDAEDVADVVIEIVPDWDDEVD